MFPLSKPNYPPDLHPTSLTPIKYLYFLTFIMISHSTITVTSRILDSSTNMQFSLLEFSTNIPAGGFIQIQFPSQFYENLLRSNAPYSGFDAAAGDFCPEDFACAGVTVSYVGGFFFRISGAFPAGSVLMITYTIKNIPTPKTAITTSSFNIKVYGASRNLVYSTTEAGITFSPKLMTCSGAISISKMVSSSSTATFTVNPTTQPTYDPTSSLKLYFPSPWANEPVITSSLPTSISCYSSTHSFASCSKSGQNVYAANINYLPSIDISIESIYNPSSVMDAGVIVITSLSASGKDINYCQVSLSGFEADEIRAASLVFSYISDAVISLKYQFIIRKKIAAGTKIIMEIPTQIDLTGATFSITRASNILNPSVATYYSGNNSLVIDPFTATTSDNLMQITCSNVNRPRAALLLSPTTISTYYNGNIVGTASCCQNFIMPRQTLVVSSPLVLDKPYLLSSSVEYTFQMDKNPSLTYLTTDQIQITFPQKYTINNGALTCSLSSDAASVSSSPTCSASNKNIKVTNFLTSDFSAAASFVLKIQGINNPAANPSTDTFIVSIGSQNNQIIQRNTNTYAVLSQAIISSLTVSSSSYTVYQSNVKITLNFATSGIVQKGYSFQISIPTQITIKQSDISCKINTVASICWVLSAQIIKIEAPINQLSTTISVQISGLVNPLSYQPTDSFALSVYDIDNNKIQKTSPSLNQFLTMTTAASFPQIIAAVQSPYSIYSSLTLTILIVFPFATTTQINLLTITYDSTKINMNVGGSSSCTSCNFVNNTVTRTVSSGLYVLEVSITNVAILVPITQASPTLSVKLQKTGGYLSVQNTNTMITKMIPASITYSLSQSSWAMSQATSLTINYNLPTTISPPTSYLILSIPQQYSTTLPNNKYNYTALTGTISLPSTQITNPSIQQSSYFYLSAYSPSDDLIAISKVNNKQFSVICELPCKECNGVTNCTGCYSMLSEDKLLKVGGVGSCVAVCPSGYYLDSTSIQECLTCNSNCLTCAETSGTICLTCPTNNYLHRVDNKCYSNCPTSYFQDQKWCTSCPSICLQCINETYCTQCQNTLYLYNNLCLISCPPSTYSLTSPLRCIDCPFSNCLFCSSIACLTCSYPYYLYNGRCYLNCPSSLLPDLEGSCSVCQCATCRTYSYNCTGCSGVKPYLYLNKCYTACPAGMYPGSSNICASCPSNCLQCRSATYCQLCQQNYAVLVKNLTYSSCQTSCPSNYILTLSGSSYVACQLCTFPCQTCNISTTFCLTCSTNFLFHNNTCISSCPSNLHPINGSCQLCIPECQNCTSDPYNCTECNTGYYLHSSNCYQLCPMKTYTDPNSKSCIDCDPLCSTCETSGRCTACVAGYFLLNGNCQVDCPKVPDYYYEYQGHCQLCQPQCLSCLDSPIACSSCSSSQYLLNTVTNQCTFSCQQPYFKNNSFCIPCQSPCNTCDSTYNVCQTCTTNKYLLTGQCLSSCPSGYFPSSQVIDSYTTGYCQKCEFPCLTCIEDQCVQCQAFAFLYKTTCVLECPDDRPFQKNGYCSDCLGVGLCAVCAKADNGSDVCSQCVYPYILFQGQCLNSCPQNYTLVILNTTRSCQKSQEFIQYLSLVSAQQSPLLPPMIFLILFLVLTPIFYCISTRLYSYTYHTGYLISLLIALQTLCLYYTLINILNIYKGQYGIYNALFQTNSAIHSTRIPLILMIGALVFNNIILLVIYYIAVLGGVYYIDARYKENIQNNGVYWWMFTILLMPSLGGHRLHKINYSKLFGLKAFSFRIVSVSKFERQDYLTFVAMIGDLCAIASSVIILFNLNLTHHTLIYTSYEIICFKVILWVLLFWDLKKPDRGFFMGDQKQAQLDMEREEEEERKLKRIDTEDLIRLVRTKSAGDLFTNKLYDDLEIDDFKSVYNPQQYEDVPKVPNRKIQKNIYKGNFRRGKRITVEQRLKRFVDKLKPPPKAKQDIYIKDLLYWRPPKIKVAKVEKPNEESMLELLNRKQDEYRQEIQEAQFEEQKKNRNYYIRNRYNQTNAFDEIDETIPNETLDYFYPSSIETNNLQFREQSIDHNDLMNLNYARKKHLKQNRNRQPQQSLRVLHHNPKKKRRNAFKNFGEMVMKKFQRQYD